MPKIDIVYLWVDGRDAAWQHKRHDAFLAQQTAMPSDTTHHAPYGNVAGRYRDNGELRYNLRALSRFFPDHGNIFIVTDCQVPHWLLPARDIFVVDHATLIPAGRLPVFDSGNIESYVHRIPGLSEQFIYLNDDVFFGAPVMPRDWFDPFPALPCDLARINDGMTLQPEHLAPVNGAIMAGQWLKSRYSDYVQDARLFAHAPRALCRSILYDFEVIARDVFDAVRATTFRDWRVPPVITELLPRWMCHIGLGHRIERDTLYISSGDIDAERSWQILCARFGDLPFFCINDTCDNAPDNDPRLTRVADVLQHVLPTPSLYERH
ncbi:stealth family protein [Robbsia andropogonis]|uniref:stealth family protein n=1 Tax=Robbsia andropogonis TaxID=28092 RepID=UPI002A69F35A|nr:stealth family protein [Robbsia andropogonis]